MITDYEAALRYLHGRPRVMKKPPKVRMRYLLKLLGNPQSNLDMIHVAGTNGKGSCVAYLSEMFQAAGISVGTFTSPFMITFNERISVNGEPISDDMIVSLTETVKREVDKIDAGRPDLRPSEFEIITAMMFVYFQRHPVDVLLVEAGIGGQSDATNVIKPQLSIITTIGMDHMKLLGGTVEKIASDKAGIIKSGIPAVIGKVAASPLSVIQKHAAQVGSKLFEMGKDYQFQITDPSTFDFQNDHFNLSDIAIKMRGAVEVEDAAVAIEAFSVYTSRVLDCDEQETAIRKGILATKWIGRMELVLQEPPVMIDGAHNVPAMTQLVKALKNGGQRKITIVMAVFADKEYEKMVNLAMQVPNVELILTSFSAVEKRKSADFSGMVKNIPNQNIRIAAKWQEAIVHAIQDDRDNHLILVTGSLLFISDVRKFLIKLKNS